jgi:hypothetical protein
MVSSVLLILSNNINIEQSLRNFTRATLGLIEDTTMFCLTPEARNSELIEATNCGLQGSRTSTANRNLVRTRVYKDEALVAATLRELPQLLSSLESFRE